MSINRRVFDCLLYTGFEVCLFPEFVTESAAIPCTNRTLKAANGSSIPILGEVTLPVSVGDCDVQVTGLVSQHVCEVMFGIDFLVKNKAIWDFAQSKIWIAETPHLLHSRSSKHHWCRRVFLQENTTIPARSEAVLSTKAQFHNLSDACVNQDWATELSRFEDGLHVSRTLVPRDVWSNIPVRTLNATSKPVSLHAGTVISELQQVDVLDKSAQGYSRSVHDAEVEAEKVPEFLQKLLDDVHDSVPEGISSALKAILINHLDVFSTGGYDLGQTDIIMHHGLQTSF